MKIESQPREAHTDPRGRRPDEKHRAGVQGGGGHRSPPGCWWGQRAVRPLRKTARQFLKRRNADLLRGRATSVPGTDPRGTSTHVHTRTVHPCTRAHHSSEPNTESRPPGPDGGWTNGGLSTRWDATQPGKGYSHELHSNLKATSLAGGAPEVPAL